MSLARKLESFNKKRGSFITLEPSNRTYPSLIPFSYH